MTTESKQWACTMHCIEGVRDNHAINSRPGEPMWAIWDADGPQGVYLDGNDDPALDTGPAGVGQRGAQILAACVHGADADPELPERLMDAWKAEIWG